MAIISSLKLGLGQAVLSPTFPFLPPSITPGICGHARLLHPVGTRLGHASSFGQWHVSLRDGNRGLPQHSCFCHSARGACPGGPRVTTCAGQTLDRAGPPAMSRVLAHPRHASYARRCGGSREKLGHCNVEARAGDGLGASWM